MEKWSEAFEGMIPEDIYQLEIVNGEETGLIVKLFGKSSQVVFKFGIVLAVRMFDEGIVQSDVYSDKEIKKFRETNFQNVIYNVHGGEFCRKVVEMASGYLDDVNVKQYVLITRNYNLDIITEFEPDIEVVEL